MPANSIQSLPITEQSRKVVICGQGYVGLPISMQSVSAGYTVVGLETSIEKVSQLSANKSYIGDVTDDDLKTALDSGRYLPTSDISKCDGFDIAVITVPTPLKDGAPDLTFVEQSARDLGALVKPGCLVILESTTYPGTTEEIVAPILAEFSGLEAGSDFLVGYSPERIDPGNPNWSLTNTPKVVSGVNERSLAAVQSFYGDLVECTVPVSSPGVAELSKLIENTFRHVNVALVNEMAIFAWDLRVDVWEAIEAASTKPFGFMPFRPGPGVGGHCLPIDPSYLSWKARRASGSPFRFIELANDVNDHMPEYVVHRLTLALNQRRLSVNGSKILLLGLTYKKNTSDIRESPSIRVAHLFASMGAHVFAVDPNINPKEVNVGTTLVELTPEEVASADAVILLVDHDQFQSESIAKHAQYILDTRHILVGDVVEYL